MKKIISNNPAQTMQAAKTLVLTLPVPSVVALKGEMGAGKTVFAKGAASALGVTEEVTSPTFTIVRSYQGRQSGKEINLHHFDAYRLSGEAEAEESGLGDILGDPKGICIVEWPERIRGILGEGAVWVEIARINDTQRELILI